MIRHATSEDIAAIWQIYRHEVLTGTASWQWHPLTLDEQHERFVRQQEAGHPTLVACADGVVVGFATYGPFRAQDGYYATREHSVYVAPGAQGRGLGRALLEALIEQACERGVRVLVGALDADNAASRRLHAALGFVETGLMPGVGEKFGRSLDLVLVQRSLTG